MFVAAARTAHITSRNRGGNCTYSASVPVTMFVIAAETAHIPLVTMIVAAGGIYQTAQPRSWRPRRGSRGIDATAAEAREARLEARAGRGTLRHAPGRHAAI